MNNIIKKNQNYTYEILKNDLEFLKYEYPCIKIWNIGKSTLGQNIKCMKLGNGNKKIFINAAHHANEWLTSLIIMIFVENYLKAYDKKEIYKGYNIEDLWNKTSFYIVPMVNPDGVDLVNGFIEKNSDVYRNVLKISRRHAKIPFTSGWKANIRGVDLKNYQPFCKVL